MTAERRRRTPRLGAALMLTLVACVVAPLAAGHQLPRGAGGLTVSLSAVMLFATFGGRTVLPGWLIVVVGFLRRRRSPLRQLPAATDVEVLAGKAGIRWDGGILVAALEVAPNLAVAREDDGCALTTSELPVGMVAGLMHRYGLDIDIDIVCAGEHVPAGSAYRTVYSQFVGSRPIVAQRRSWLVLRLNVTDNLDGISARGPSLTTAPRALATAAHRVVQRLGEQQIRAYVLSGTELNSLADLLLGGIPANRCRERWSTIKTDTSYVTTYLADPTEISTAALHQWWAWRTEHTTMMIRLTAGADGPRIGALVRYATLGEVQRPPSGALNVPAGIQEPLLQAALPGGDVSLATDIPSTCASAIEDVRVPIGPAGQILGHADGAIVALSLCDHSGRPERLRVDARIELPLAHQLVLRAVVTGSVVALHTNDRTRWDRLVATVDDPQRLFYATAGARDCDIAVFDGSPVNTVPARTVLTLSDSGESFTGGADLVLTQEAGSTMEVTVRDEPPVPVSIIRTREEDRYLGIDVQSAQPRRVIHTEPVLTRSPRPHVPAAHTEQAHRTRAAPPPSTATPHRADSGRPFRFAQPRRSHRDQPRPAMPAAPRRRPKLPPTPPPSG
ncbi:type VII secretion protein EccE [Mycolicibacterium sp. XJ870]